MNFWVDSHCHMNDEIYSDNFQFYHNNSLEASVLLSNLICLNEKDYLRSKQIKNQYRNNYDISFGYFPADCEDINNKDLDYLANLVKQDDDIVLIGEIGLDYHYDGVNKEKQQQLFIEQIEMANQLNKPIMRF